jgi:hypothetical protein
MRGGLSQSLRHRVQGARIDRTSISTIAAGRIRALPDATPGLRLLYPKAETVIDALFTTSPSLWVLQGSYGGGGFYLKIV